MRWPARVKEVSVWGLSLDAPHLSEGFGVQAWGFGFGVLAQGGAKLGLRA